MQYNNTLIKRCFLGTYRYGHWVYFRVRIPIIRQVFLFLYLVLDLVFVRIFTGSHVPPECRIGRRLKIPHPSGIIIQKNVVIGDHVTILHQVTIGINPMSASDRKTAPRIGDHVYIGAGAKIIGAVRVGDHARIGANAVVTRDIPAHCTAVGIPAKVIANNAPSTNDGQAEGAESAGAGS